MIRSNGALVRDEKSFTVACADGALGKVATFFIEPPASDGIVYSLPISYFSEELTAATRAIRADFYGPCDSTSDVYAESGDRIAIVSSRYLSCFDRIEPGEVEAYWGENGALCINVKNLRESISAKNLEQANPCTLEDKEDDRVLFATLPEAADCQLESQELGLLIL